MYSHCCVDCGPVCHGRSIVIDEDGRAECRFFVDTADLGECDAERGWFDPDGEPQIISGPDGERRHCEVVQLMGAALQACQNTLECSGCGSGFCATSVPELDESEYCGNDHFWPLRFVGGALAAPGERVTGVCLTN